MNYLSKIFLSLVFLVGIICFANSNTTKVMNFDFSDSKIDISEILSNIPVRDKKRLEYFFREFFVTNFLGYVLFHAKPVAIHQYLDSFKDTTSISFSFFVPSNLKSRKSYKTWLKYRDLFPMSNFVIKEEKNPWANRGSLVIVLNKQLFIETVDENIHDFEVVLGRKIHSEDLWKEVQEKPLLTDILKLHDGLIGTLLGYGRNNSWKFYSERTLPHNELTIRTPWEKNIVFNKIDNLIRSIGFVDQFCGNFTQDLNLTFLPAFKAIIGSSETNQLINKYVDCREKMLNFYVNKDFLETTLKLLTADTKRTK